MFLQKNFCEKRKYIGLKTRDFEQKCFWWCGYFQRNKFVSVFQQRKSWVCHKYGYGLGKINDFDRYFRNILRFNFINISKPKKLSARPNSFWELGSRVPPLFPALVKNTSLFHKPVCFYLFFLLLAGLSNWFKTKLLARACGFPVGRRSGGRLATTLVATKNVIIFSFLFSFLFFPVVYFSHRRSARIKKLI